MNECPHCKGPIEIRMPVPESKCDHLYYPENCFVCAMKRKRAEIRILKSKGKR